MTKKIGFIGIGMMGHGMARNLLAKGFKLRFMVHRNLDGGTFRGIEGRKPALHSDRRFGHNVLPALRKVADSFYNRGLHPKDAV